MQLKSKIDATKEVRLATIPIEGKIRRFRLIGFTENDSYSRRDVHLNRSMESITNYAS